MTIFMADFIFKHHPKKKRLPKQYPWVTIAIPISKLIWLTFKGNQVWSTFQGGIYFWLALWINSSPDFFLYILKYRKYYTSFDLLWCTMQLPYLLYETWGNTPHYQLLYPLFCTAVRPLDMKTRTNYSVRELRKRYVTIYGETKICAISAAPFKLIWHSPAT